LINIDDIVSAVEILINSNIQSGNFVLKNSKYYNISKLIKLINKDNDKKIRIKWLSNKTIKNEIINNKKLKSWKPKKSTINDIKNLILN
jgi:hypothetical protein